MAKAGADATGMKELNAAIDRLPQTVTAALRGVAKNSAERIKIRAHDLAPVGGEPRGEHTAGNPHMRDTIAVTEEADKKQFVVGPNTPWLPELGLWIERGTVHMSARPFMRPAGDEEDSHYKRESLAAADQAVTKALK